MICTIALVIAYFNSIFKAQITSSIARGDIHITQMTCVKKYGQIQPHSKQLRSGGSARLY